MKSVAPIGFGAAFGMALLLATAQYFLSPLYLEMEYEYGGFPPPRPLSRDERYVASQAFLSYLNVENGGATLLSLGELRFASQPFFTEADLACVFRAKELRGSVFGLTFVLGIATIALGLFTAADDFDRARRMLLLSVFGVCLAYTLLSVLARVAFSGLAPLLAPLFASETCVLADVRGLPLIFPTEIFRDGLVLLALFARIEALAIGAAGWLFGLLVGRINKRSGGLAFKQNVV
jgi:hypothetical protein